MILTAAIKHLIAGADKWSLLKEPIARFIIEWAGSAEITFSSGYLIYNQLAKASMRTAFSSILIFPVLKFE